VSAPTQTTLDRIVAALDSAAEGADLAMTRDHTNSEVSILRFYPSGSYDAVLTVDMEAHFNSLILTVTLRGEVERVLHTRCKLDTAGDTVEQLCKIIAAAGTPPK